MMMSMRLPLTISVVALVLFSAVTIAGAAEEQPIDVIEDNSFLIEEAYNQEPGVVQHIFNAIYTNSGRRHGWQFSFTQEWPVYGLDHQLSYTIPSSHLVDDGDHQNGVGDVLINYRYQALEEGPNQPAFAPRFSLILPTGSRDKGTGNGVVGYQWSLPFSKKVSSRLALHANLGLTYLPHVRSILSNGHLSPKRSLVSYNLGGSAIFAILPRLHAMLEWIGVFEDDINDAGRAVHNFKPVISPGFRTAVVNEEELQIVVGAAAPIGLNRHSDNFGALLYFSIEHKLF
jgi:hypothetical protein